MQIYDLVSRAQASTKCIQFEYGVLYKGLCSMGSEGPASPARAVGGPYGWNHYPSLVRVECGDRMGMPGGCGLHICKPLVPELSSRKQQLVNYV